MNLPKPLKWVGSKRSLAAELQDLIGPLLHDSRLVEPFVGGGGSLFALMPQRALLADINPYLIHFYHWLQAGLFCDRTPFVNSSEHYYANRVRFNTLIQQDDAFSHVLKSKEIAELFYFLVTTGYNGAWRMNNSGEHNIPWGGMYNGKIRTINYRTDFRPYQSIVEPWEFRLGDFESLTPLLHPTDVLYLDPPYFDGFTKYAKEDFNPDDQVRLAKWAAQHPGPVVISNKAIPAAIELYKSHGFELRYVYARRSISCKGDRKPAKEILAHRNLPFETLKCA